MAQHTVLSTSGWQGDGWSYRGSYDTLAEAEARRKEIATSDARSNGYITEIAGKTTICDEHDFCFKVKFHGKTVHASEAGSY